MVRKTIVFFLIFLEKKFVLQHLSRWLRCLQTSWMRWTMYILWLVRLRWMFSTMQWYTITLSNTTRTQLQSKRYKYWNSTMQYRINNVWERLFDMYLLEYNWRTMCHQLCCYKWNMFTNRRSTLYVYLSSTNRWFLLWFMCQSSK